MARPIDTETLPVWGFFSPIMRRVLMVNFIAIAILGFGILYLNQFRADLIEERLKDLEIQAEIIAGALGEAPGMNAETIVLPTEDIKAILTRLVNPTDTRALVFAPDGTLLVDSFSLEAEATISVSPLDDGSTERSLPGRIGDWINRWLDSLAEDSSLPLYGAPATPGMIDFAEIIRARAGETVLRQRRTMDGPLLLSATVPVQRFRRVLGMLVIAADTADIQSLIRQERVRFLKVFGVSFAVTLLLSIFLANTIARPIRGLVRTANEVRRGIGRTTALDRFSGRKDEIGALSRALGDMTAALYKQLDNVESFAADVAHELKNPLSSLRSAAETLSNTNDKATQDRLIAIMTHDIGRLDRLITDISDASRLDAELSRSEMEDIDLTAMLQSLVDAYGTTGKTNGVSVRFEQSGEGAIRVHGIADRLGQVIYNLVDNALSFSPKGGTVTLRLSRDTSFVHLYVDDMGPGLPAGSQEKIFSRFYSERPESEGFGKHSGLGLSISKQIIDAHRGDIQASNRFRDDATDNDAPIGARFHIRLPTVSD